MKPYTFANFQVGKTNELAFTAAKAVVEEPALLHNPLFLYGRPGLGKTHLLKAIEAGVKAANPQAKTQYVKCCKLIESLRKARKSHSADSFPRTFQSTELLLIDDVHVLYGKMDTEGRICDVISLCVNAGHQVVVSSAASPVRTDAFEWLTRNTFARGLVADIRRPDAELTGKIALQTAALTGLQLSDSQVDLITRLDFENVRLIEDLVNWIAANAAPGPVATSNLITDALEFMRIYCR